MSDLSVSLTDKAIAHFQQLVEKEQDMHLRIAVLNPGSERASVDLSYCLLGSEEKSDLKLSYPTFNLYIDYYSVEALRDATIDYKEEGVSGKLHIKAHFLKGVPLKKGASLAEQIQFFLDREINPMLARHKGFVQMVGFVHGKLMLQFEGGCKGCGMAGVTMQQGIETSLKEKFPSVREIVDVTNHEAGTEPYYG